jgi:DNA-directed RNA polymerase subunit H (RpoH/RPB5)
MSKNSTSSLISSIYRSRKNILEIMDKQQGYSVEEYDHFSVNEVNTMNSNEQLDMLLEKTGGSKTYKTYIRYYLGTKKLSEKNINEMIDDLFNLEQVLNKETDTLFIMTKDDMNDTLTDEVKHIWEGDKVFVVVQSIKRLQFNILNHVLQPKFIVLSENEKKEVMIKFNVTADNQFPEISRFDPVAQLIGIRPGQLCRIIRPSKTAVTTDYYRLCV